MTKRLQFWIGILISALCLAAVLWLVDLGGLLSALRAADWRLILVVAAGQVSFMLLRAWRWQVMLSAGADVRYWPLWHAQNIGYLVTNLLPFRLGDLARSYLAGLEPGLTGVQALSSVVLERVLDMLMIVVFFGLAVPFAPAIPHGLASAGLGISAAAVAAFGFMLWAAADRPRVLRLAGWLLARLPRLDTEVWLDRADSFLDGFVVLTRWRLLLPVMGLSVLAWLCIVAGYFWGLRGFWPQATLPAALFALGASGFGVAAPSSPGYVGVFHGAVVLGLSVFPVTREQAFAFATVYHAVMYLVVLALGLLALWQSGQSLGGVLAATRKMNKA